MAGVAANGFKVVSVILLSNVCVSCINLLLKNSHNLIQKKKKFFPFNIMQKSITQFFQGQAKLCTSVVSNSIHF